MPHQLKSKKSAKQSNSLRIIGGQWRGRKLAFPDLPGLRPTPDRVRETLFNWLTPVIHGARCLDLFTGSGALSLEALSRGAGHATLLDQAPSVITQLREHLTTLKCQSAQLIQANTLAWLAQSESNRVEPYDIIFLDPPFRLGLIEPCCKSIQANQLLKPNGVVYIEAETSARPKIPTNWQIYRETKAGQVTGYLCSLT